MLERKSNQLSKRGENRNVVGVTKSLNLSNIQEILDNRMSKYKYSVDFKQSRYYDQNLRTKEQLFTEESSQEDIPRYRTKRSMFSLKKTSLPTRSSKYLLRKDVSVDRAPPIKIFEDPYSNNLEESYKMKTMNKAMKTIKKA